VAWWNFTDLLEDSEPQSSTVVLTIHVAERTAHFAECGNIWKDTCLVIDISALTDKAGKVWNRKGCCLSVAFMNVTRSLSR